MGTNNLDTLHFELMIVFSSHLKTLPAEILEHQYSPESFGSWWCKFRKSGKLYRIVYDARDGFIYLENDANNSHISGKADWKEVGHLKTAKLYDNEDIFSGIKSLTFEYLK
jgi:hypothetical protein